MRMTCITFVLASFASFAFLACSGAGVSEVGGTPIVPGAEGGPPVSGEGGPDDAGVDSTTPDGATPDAAVDNRIDPIALGRSWTYDVSIIGTYPICKAGSHTGAVLGQKTTAGKPSFQVQSFCPGAGTSSYFVDGDHVEIYYGGAWILSLEAPVAETTMWTDGLLQYTWEKIGKITVPAGTFDDCWSAKHVGGVSYTRFCRGIGPVQWHYVDGTGNGYDATLTKYKL